MIKYFSILLLLSLTFTACSKSNGDDDQKANFGYYFRCKVDGDATSFMTNAMAQRIEGNHSIWVSGSNDVQTMELFILDNLNKKSVIARVYPDSTKEYQVNGTFSLIADKVRYYAGTDEYLSASIFNVDIVNHFNVTITEINDKSIKGTFSGDHFKKRDVTSEIKVITEGEFFLPFKAR